MIRRIGLAKLVLVADLGGTFLFALEGATIACRAGLALLEGRVDADAAGVTATQAREPNLAPA